MKLSEATKVCSFCIALCVFASFPGGDCNAQVKTLIQESCIHCHDESTDTALNFDSLDFDLKNEKTFAMWERIYDRVKAGEMPPEDEDRPDGNVLKKALSQIKSSLTARSLAIQAKNGRSTIRRLTRTEYEYSLHDLLGIDTELARLLPAENEAGFDTVAENQGISQLHARAWLTAANAAIDSAINLGLKPDDEPERFELLEMQSVKDHFSQKGDDNHIILGKEDDGIVIFDSGSTYLYSMRPAGMEHSGAYRIRAEAETFNSDTPVTVAIFAGNYSRGQSRILGYWDAVPGETLEIDFEPILRRREYIFPQVFDLVKPKDNSNIWNLGPEKYKGAGLKLKWVSVEGPLHNSWPPKSATNLLPGVKFKKREHLGWINNRHIQYDIVVPQDQQAAIAKSLSKLAALAFRRPLKKGEENEFLTIAKKAMLDGVSFEDAVRISMRSVLCSPHFLFHSGDPGELDDFSLASRLSYFFWKSIPDSKLLKIALAGDLNDDGVLRQQVNRMLKDPKADRFVSDFIGQWLELRRIDATTPDKRLYPEYDPDLRSAMITESETFFAELIKDDLSVTHLVNSDFAMINRRLADHYGIEGVEGQHFRRVKTRGTVRGGFLTQAAVLKTTANGTTTSPVRRGNWVLSSILGTPSPPPPPSVGSIEPDTRGTKTIREELAAHRNSTICNSCHRNIDPPGFAMESFDVIGGFRDRYRSVEFGDTPEDRLLGRRIWEYKYNLAVDPSGETPDGESFSDIKSYKRTLAKKKRQLAENLVRQLVVYSTGAEIQFADREKIESILNQCEKSEYGVRSLIHAMVQSKLFRHK